LGFIINKIFGDTYLRKVKKTTISLATTITTIALLGVVNYLNPFWLDKAVIAAEFNSLSEIQKRGKLIIGVKDNLPPLGFRDHNGNLIGLEIDMARELAKELNISNGKLQTLGFQSPSP